MDEVPLHREGCELIAKVFTGIQGAGRCGEGDPRGTHPERLPKIHCYLNQWMFHLLLGNSTLDFGLGWQRSSALEKGSERVYCIRVERGSECRNVWRGLSTRHTPRTPEREFQLSGFGFRVSGFGLRVSGFGFWVSSFGFRVSGFGFQVRALDSK